MAVPKAASPYPRRPGPSCGLSGRRGVPATVSLRATQLADLQDELHAERCEGTALATLCLESANRIHVAAAADRGDIVLDQAGRIGVAAGRFLAQRESAA